MSVLVVCKPFTEGGGGGGGRRVSTSPKIPRSTKCWRHGDLKFSSEVYPDKRLRLRRFQDGQLSGPYFAKNSAIYPINLYLKI